VFDDYEDISVKLDYTGGDNSMSGFDRFGRVVDQVWSKYGSGAGTLDEYAYTYDRAGNRLSKTNVLNGDLSETYEYNDLDELISSSREDDFDQSWTLDGLGNWSAFDDDGSAQTRDVNAANEITSTSGIATPTYDRAGNMTSDGTLKYKYDAWNRQKAVSLSDDTEVASYVYDGLNRRIAKILPNISTMLSSVNYYYNENWQIIEERSETVGGVTNTSSSNEYIWSPRYVDSPIVQFHDGNSDGDCDPTTDSGDTIRYYTSDANHNITTTITIGHVSTETQHVAYTAYGQAKVYDSTWTTSTDPTTDGPLYCGYFFDAETANSLARTRYYSVTIAAWFTRDPIQADLNLYRYVGNNPTNLTDPTGLEDRKQWPDEQSKCKALCKAINNSKDLDDFINKYDPTWGGSQGGDLLNLEGCSSIYGPLDVDWMITLLAANKGRATGIAGPILSGMDPGTIYGIGKPIWICYDGLTDPNVSIDFSRYGQEDEINAIKAARDLLLGNKTLKDIFPNAKCDEDSNCPNKGGPPPAKPPRRPDRGPQTPPLKKCILISGPNIPGFLY
jgi:RHS repeat-associated protein